MLYPLTHPGTLGCFRGLALVSNAAVSLSDSISWRPCFSSLGQTPRSRIAGSHIILFLIFEPSLCSFAAAASVCVPTSSAQGSSVLFHCQEPPPWVWGGVTVVGSVRPDGQGHGASSRTRGLRASFWRHVRSGQASRVLLRARRALCVLGSCPVTSVVCKYLPPLCGLPFG